MRDLRSALHALLLAAVLAGCSDDASSTAPGGSTSPTTTPNDPSPAASSEPEKSGEAIPDGNYARNVTVAEAKAMGITDRGFLNQFGQDGRDTYVLKVARDQWTIFTGNEVPEPTDNGTLEYDANENAVMTSESEECPGCAYTYDWSLVGDDLTLELVGHESTDTPEYVVIVRFITEGAFARQS